MPMTFPAHQGLIIPAVRRWPNSLDPLALSVGAAMPDIIDSILGFPINGYFMQWWGHSFVGIFSLDLAGGLLLTWSIASIANRLFKHSAIPRYLQAFFKKEQPKTDSNSGGQSRLRWWGSSVLVGILSHIGFDLISHDTNLLLYPWVPDPHWYPDWWYTKWFEIRRVPPFGRTHSVGVFSVMWMLLTLIGTYSFIQFLRPKRNDRR